MTDKTFHNLLTAWDVNYQYNATFRKWWDENYATKRGFYGQTEPVWGSCEYKDLLTIMRSYLKTHCVLFNEWEDYDEYSDRCEYFEKPVGSFVPEGFLEWQRERAKRWRWSFYKRA